MTSQWRDTITKMNRNAISATRQEMTSQVQLERLVYEASGTHHKWVWLEWQEVIQQITVTVYSCWRYDILRHPRLTELPSFAFSRPNQTWPGVGLFCLFSRLIEIPLSISPNNTPSVSYLTLVWKDVKATSLESAPDWRRPDLLLPRVVMTLWHMTASQHVTPHRKPAASYNTVLMLPEYGFNKHHFLCGVERLKIALSMEITL